MSQKKRRSPLNEATKKALRKKKIKKKIRFGIVGAGKIAEEYIKVITKNTIENGMPESIALNVNIPAISSEKIKGIKFCRQANAIWEETFDKRHDPYGREYYWMVGNFVNHDKGKDNDEWAIKNNYVSIVPCKFDLSSKRGLNYLNENWSI